jgi:methionyl-tRNA formyltransferase
VKLVYLGTPHMAVPPLEALVVAGHEIALVVTNPDRRRGRGGSLSPSPVKAAAERLGLTVSHDVDDTIRVGADLGVVVAYGQLIRPTSSISTSRSCPGGAVPRPSSGHC